MPKSLVDSYESLIDTYRKTGKAVDVKELVGFDPLGTKKKAFNEAVKRGNPKKVAKKDAKEEEINSMQSIMRQKYMQAKGHVK